MAWRWLYPARAAWVPNLGLAPVLALLLLAPALDAQQRPSDALDAVLGVPAARGAPGCAAAIERDGLLLAARGYGTADLAGGIPVTPATTFYAGSVTKQFVATGIVLLAEQGRLRLDDSLARFIPEAPEAIRGITLRQLLHHTAGVRDYLGLATRRGRDWADRFTNAEALALVLAETTTDFVPGSAYRYSNSNYLLLAEVIARVTGAPFRVFAEHRLLAPLGMTDSRMHDRLDAAIPDLATGYRTGPDSAWVPWPLAFAAVGSGGLYTSARDLARWSGHWWHDRLGSGAWSVVDTLDGRGVLTTGDTIAYAMGVIRGSYRGLPTRRHDGGLAGYRAALLQFPTEHLGIVVLCNGDRAGAGALVEAIADRVLVFPDPVTESPSPP